MAERAPFSEAEWYHCFSRGIDKRKTFNNRIDYERFLALLYICNSNATIHRSDLYRTSLHNILSISRSGTLTAIGAFCIMPNHFHLLLKETQAHGISTFMQKLGTAYVMYFNLKYERNGSLFAKPFKSRHVSDDRYFQKVLQYIHFNPAEIFEPQWKDGVVHSMEVLEERLIGYPYSSLGSYVNKRNVLRPILDASVFDVESQLSPREMLVEAREYYEHVKASP